VLVVAVHGAPNHLAVIVQHVHAQVGVALKSVLLAQRIQQRRERVELIGMRKEDVEVGVVKLSQQLLSLQHVGQRVELQQVDVLLHL